MNLELFNTGNLFDAATNLFHQLGIKLNSNTAEALATKDLLKNFYKDNDAFNAIKSSYFIGLIDDSVFRATGMFDVNYSVAQALEQADRHYDGLMLFALELDKQPTRSEISDLTRAFNRISQKMPVALVFKYKVDNETIISIAISERFKYLQNWRQGEKVGKVIILRDIHAKNTHAGHQRILQDLVRPSGVTNYAQLHAQWLDVLDVNILNKKFFQELANWYFWAMDEVQFPDDIEKNQEKRNSTNLIRLITRIIFIWFIKEKHLVPASLFNKDYLKNILTDFLKKNNSNDYYKAILQNLFFATLNQKMGDRNFADDHNGFNKEDQGIKTKYRYSEKFIISKQEIIELFKDIPFLNGGLFDCLDRFDEEKLVKGKKEQLFTDGFTRIVEKQAVIPDILFFGEEIEVDLKKYFDPEAKRPIIKKVKGLIKILNNYKFTVTENTPNEEEIALDPELLGKVFENLLASYNPETKTTARKQTGSFYTPREIVNYMADESLIEYLKQNLEIRTDNLESRIRNLFSYHEEGNPFDSHETDILIRALNNVKILDPACGSGAFPMGMLHKMVHLLKKLDPGNQKWKTQQKEKIIGAQIKELEKDKKSIEGLNDKDVRDKATKAVVERLHEVEEIFESKNFFDDYARKLYLIENCIYGIDIQPIAVQISKLRFFISLIIDQEKDNTKENLGYRSLPNLETKFVAANTLVSLDKPKLVTGDIFIQDKLDLIKSKSEQLKEIRHNYFSAKLRKEKLHFQSEDKKLRKEISELLVKIGHTRGNAFKISSFDPYDQNHFANWFEPEWMFALNGGFNIVIGNPPYGLINKKQNKSESIVVTEDELKFYKNSDYYQPAQGGMLNIYRLFILRSTGLLKANGIFSEIFPLAFIGDVSNSNLRKYIFNNYQIIFIEAFPERDNPNKRIFEAVKMSVCILNLKNIQKEEPFYLRIHDNRFISEKAEKNYLDLQTLKLLDNSNYSIPLSSSKEIDILVRIFKNSKKFSEIGKCNTGEVDMTFCKDAFSENSNNPVLLKGAIIDRYLLRDKMSQGEIVYIDEKILTKIKVIDFTLKKSERIVLQGITGVNESTRLKMMIISNAYCANSLNYLTINEEVNLKYLLALFNSKLLNFIFSKFSTNSNVNGYEIDNLPIYYEGSMESPLVKLVEITIELKKSGHDSSFFERLIDAMVYELYLSEVIKASGAEVLKYVKDLPALEEGQNDKNLRIIDKVYKELSNPKHPISATLLKLLTIDEINIIEGRA